jgi:hypothetical protein
MLALVVVVIALVLAIRGTGKAVGASYRRRMDSWAAEHPDASRIHHRAAALGQMLATLRYGGPALKHGWQSGWRLGWDSGKEWAAKHKPIQPMPVDPEPITPTTPTPTATPSMPRLRGDGRADLRPVPPMPSQPTTAPTAQQPATKGSPAMAIETATGGEVTSPETLYAELQAKVNEHGADMEDATADAARAEEEMKRTDLLAASMKKMKYPPNDIALVTRLLEPAKSRLDAANQRKAAAAQSLAGAKAALDMAARHVQLVGQAAGSAYGN